MLGIYFGTVEYKIPEGYSNNLIWNTLYRCRSADVSL
jgi:hypothetical protein